MNTGHGSKSHNAYEHLPFAAEVYRAAEPAQRGADLDDLRAEMRNEVRSLRAHLTRSTGSGEIGREIAAIRAALEGMALPPAPVKRSDRIAKLLRASGIEGAAAVRIATRAKESPEADCTSKLAASLTDVVALAPWNAAEPGRRIMALVGPAGVGKTTTVAKLAAAARMNGKSVALVSCDGFRVGAVDQLERYAELLGATFHVARTASELANVLEEETADIVFVDTSGRPPSATQPEAALAARRKKGAPAPVDVMLCLPASIRLADAVRAVGIFASLSPTGICITKLDETASPSGLVHGPWAAKLPLAIMCAGPRVPEDITPATREAFLAAMCVEEVSK